MVAYSRRRITLEDKAAFFDALSYLDIEVEVTPPLTVIGDGAESAIRLGLTAYDAAYVDLARREKLILATLDGAMRKAAEQLGVVVLR